MSLSTSEDYTPHSGNERVIDLDHLDDLPLNVKQDDKDVLGDFDILHKQLDPEERKSAVVHDFSAYKKPTEIIEGPVSESIDGLDIEDLRTKINSNLEDNNFDAAYNIIQKIDSESVLHAVLSEAITFLIRKKEFSVAKKFVRLIHNMDVYTTELNYILEKERNTDPLSDFKSQNDEVVVNKIEIKKPKKEVEPVFANTEKGSISDINERTIDETNEELISDEDYDNFVKKGDVSGDILVNIADRMARGEKTTERELAIYQTFGPKIELLLRNRKEGGKDTIDIDSLVKVERVDPITSKEIFEKVTINGDEFGGKILTPEYLENEGLVPEYKITIENTTYWFASSGYNLLDGRIGVVAYVQNGDEVVARSYYRSNSQGVWRYLPDYTENAGHINWFGKGFSEESITLPFLVQKALSDITSDEKTIKTVNNPEFVFAGTAKKFGNGGSYYSESNSEPKKLEGNFYDKRFKTLPENLEIQGDSAPDFSNLILSWNQKSGIYGKYKIEVFPSKDGKLRYMFCRDGNGRAWIGGIEDDSELQSTGLKKSWINGGDLTTPALEYDTQSAGYGKIDPDLSSPHYLDMFDNYLSKSPIIREYLDRKVDDELDEERSDSLVTEPIVSDTPSVPNIENTDILEKMEKDLEDSRKEFVAQEAVWRAKNQQSKSWFRKNVLGNLGMDKQTPLIPEQSELEEARIVYNLAKKNKLRETIGMGDITVLLEETERERKTLESLKSSYSPKVIKESQLNRDIRTGFLGLNSKEEDGVVYEVEKGVFAEKFESMSQKAMDKWSKLPKPVQIATSTALVTGTSFTFGLAAAAGPLGYAGYRVAKSALFGGVVAQPLGKFVDNIHNRKNKASEEESLEEFSEGINIDNFEEKEAERMARDEKMVDEKKKQRFVKAMTKVAAGGIVSAGMEMSGASSLLFDKGDIDLPGKGTLNVPNDFGDVDKNLDKLEKFRLNAKEVLPTDDKLDNLKEFKPAVSSNLDTTQVVNEAPSDLIIQDIHNLKAQIMSQYGGEVPDSLKPIMEKTPKELIKIFDFNNPGNTDFKPGVDTEDLTIDSNGNVYYVHQDGSRQTLFDSQKGKFYRFDGTEAEKTISSIGTDGSEIYPNGQIGDKVYSKLDFGGNKVLTPDPVVQTVGTEVLEGDPIFKTEAVSVLDVKDTTEEEVANNTVSHTELPQGKSVDVFRMGEDKIVSYDGARIGQEVLQNGKKTLVLDDTYQDGEQYRSTREAFSKAFEANATVENVGTNPIAESFEGGKIYITYNIPNDPNSVRVYLNGKEIAVGDTTVVDSKGIPKIKMHGNLKGGWFLVDNAYERAFKHIDKLIKAGTFNFKN